jgi:hypothetical protein
MQARRIDVFVGNCFVLALMDGEAKSFLDDGRTQIQTFEVRLGGVGCVSEPLNIVGPLVLARDNQLSHGFVFGKGWHKPRGPDNESLKQPAHHSVREEQMPRSFTQYCAWKKLWPLPQLGRQMRTAVDAVQMRFRQRFLWRLAMTQH